MSEAMRLPTRSEVRESLRRVPSEVRVAFLDAARVADAYAEGRLVEVPDDAPRVVCERGGVRWPAEHNGLNSIIARGDATYALVLVEVPDDDA